MHEIEIIKDLVIIFGLASVVIFLFNKFKLPSVIGFLITGIIAGPYGLGLITDKESTDILAEIGVILLLFTIGIEFSFSKLIRIKSIVLIGGTLQIFITIFSVFGLLSIIGVSYNIAVFIGFLVALSSTAIILKVLQEKDQINTHHGKISLGILIFQDLIIVPMMLFVPLLSGKSDNITSELIVMIIKSLVLVGITFAFARWLVPYLLHQIALSKSQELFLITIIVIGFSIANLSAMLGLSLALGAFLAGLAISESEYSHHAFGNLVPFRDIFSGFFFVSIGMLLNLNFFISNILIILIVTFILIIVKSTIVGFVSFVLGYPFKIALRSGFILAQIGEFSFILVQIGQQNKLIDGFYYQLFLAVAILSMSVTPIFIIFSEKITNLLAKIPMPKVVRKGFKKLPESHTYNFTNHTILVGNKIQVDGLMKSLKLVNISFVIIDLDADRVRELQTLGINAIYGHAQYESVLEHANIKNARNMLLSVNETYGNASIIGVAKSLNPNINIIVRTKFIEDLEYLYQIGANYVIPIEFETSLEMLSRTLSYYLVPHEEIEKTIAQFRSDGYKTLRIEDDKPNKKKVYIPNFEISTFIVHKNSIAINKSIKELDLQNKTGITVLAIKKQEIIIPNPDSEIILEFGDTIYTLGNFYNTSCFNDILNQDYDK
ncbi:MAG: cation:proton antiporter [Bacteroidales bacterium]|nr:cation:proton antiporter [Bacteroidales bacterium]MBN2757555.1 cation:proton antiporter [Bacteroidales bacterium]